MAESDLLVSPAWLRANLGAPDLVVADVRWVPGGSAREAFELRHIPGAVLFDADVDLAAPAFTGGPGRHPLPSPADLARTMSRAGIGDETRVVVCDDAAGSLAARLWWMLDAIGHPWVAVLDGALDGWGGPWETGPGSPPAAADFTARPWPEGLIADADQIAIALGNGAALVLDARAPERYRGELEPIDPVAGHIPGARNAPWAANVDPATGRLLQVADLRKSYRDLGVDGQRDVIVHCGSGLTACHDILAIRLAGLGRARLYEGSWSGWVSDPSRPVATGPETGEDP